MPTPSPPGPERRALLLTDVVDSTKLSEALGDEAMAELWARHDRVARDLLVDHHGREIDKTDGFLMLFTEAADAVRYAVAYHRALGELGIAARAGLHVGPVILTENAPADVARGAKPLEVDGIAKPTAARVMSVATGGQTLLTEAAVEALGDTELRLESHGHWRMKGVAEPIELFEVGDEYAPFQPPPDAGKVYRVVEKDGLWLPVKEVKHSLPAERDAFVGRTADLQALHGLLDEARLVSVLGIGGTGKTRLVTRYGWTWLGDFPGGVWFCDLSEARSVDGIVSAVARALDVPLGRQDPVVHLGHAIAGRGPCLVILDNFEQVASFSPDTLSVWLDRAKEARFVVTTREVLGLPGETALPLAPLVTEESRDLFVARARQAKPAFEPTDTASIEALVALLDHLPLAIELAAARVRMMPPKTLLKRMSQRFKLLASRGGRHTRQATLRGALDWSWDLLDPDEQAALAQLSVFEGGFTLEAAEGVLDLEELWGTDAVQALVDKSLVRQVEDERFDMLVSVQEYAAEKLDERGTREGAESQHAAFFAELGSEPALDALHTHGGVARRKALARELDNVVVACRRSIAREDGKSAVTLLWAAWAVLDLSGPTAPALDLAERVNALRSLSDEGRASARVVCAQAARSLGRLDDARRYYDAALAFHQEVGDRRGEARVLGNLGNVDLVAGRMDEARRHYEAALALHREFGDRRSEGKVLGNLGTLDLHQGRIDEAQAHYEASLELHREVGDRRTEGQLLGGLGNLLLGRGLMDEARRRYEASLAIYREIGDRVSEGRGLANLGSLMQDQGRLDEALALYEDALVIHREVGDRHGEGFLLSNLGNLQTEQGRLEEARSHLDAALAITREVGDRRFEGFVLGSLGGLSLDQGRTNEAREFLQEGEEFLRELELPRDLAKLLCTRVRLESAEGELDAARVLFAEADQLAGRVGAGPESALGQDLAAARAALEDA